MERLNLINDKRPAAASITWEQINRLYANVLSDQKKYTKGKWEHTDVNWKIEIASSTNLFICQQKVFKFYWMVRK